MSRGDQDETLPEAFWAVARQLRQMSKEALAPWGITPSQSRAVMTLLRHGTVRLSQLSEHLRIAPRSATEVVDGLQDLGLVERLPDPHDRRATLVRLTDRGAELGGAIRAARSAEAEGFFSKISESDRAELARILGQLRK